MLLVCVAIGIGRFDILVHGKRVAMRREGECFGELALMYNQPRAATGNSHHHFTRLALPACVCSVCSLLVV